MSKIGLVFAGGGGKGAYEIGVWKALKEFGMDKSIHAISGTSVGGLNSALFVKNDFEQAIKVWEEMNPEKILQIDIQSIATALGKLLPQTRIPTFILEKLGFLKSQGIFTQEGLESIIRDSLKDGDLKDKIPFYICATEVSKKIFFNPLYKKLNDLDYETMVKYLLATSAIPIAFPKIEIENKILLDGFLTDNTPMKPLIEIEKCDNIIIVLLGRSETILKEKLNYPNINFWEITPTGNTKESLGSLDFKNITANKLIEMGYNDTSKILQDIYEFMLIEKEYIKTNETLKIQNNGFKKLISNNSLLRSEYKQLSTEFHDMNSLQYLLSTNKVSKFIKRKNSLTHDANLLDTNVSNINEFDLVDIDNKVEDIIKKATSNSLELSKFAIESITSLSSTEGKINYQIEQNTFSRLWNSVTGSNQKLQANINYDFSQALYANTQMLKKLAERSVLSLDLCIVLGNKVNFLANNQNFLQEQNIQQFQIMKNLKSAIESNTKRIVNLENNQQLLLWSHSLKGSIKNLNLYDSLLLIIEQYFKITKKFTNNLHHQFLYSTLVNLDFDEKYINPTNFIEYIIDNKLNNDFLPIPKEHEFIHPIYSSVSKVTNNGNFSNLDNILLDIENNYGLNLDIDISCIDLTFEILNGYKIAEENNCFRFNSVVQVNDFNNLLQKKPIDTFEAEVNKISSLGAFIKIKETESEVLVKKNTILKDANVSNIKEIFKIGENLTVQIKDDKKCIVVKSKF
ncbi:MAG: patatin-like phospholipase family protein [Halarcobacter ebronensis]|uniref:patatin-like phospholipase family protein n=1 Tax=Halarcobacter ebronensis TaxID=1462615 RepID=UPI003C78460C